MLMLSQETANVLTDLIENKLGALQVDDRDDLRELITLQRCLAELKGVSSVPHPDILKDYEGMEIPHRGRHRKMTSIR